MEKIITGISAFQRFFDKKYGKGTLVEVSISDIILPSQIITNFSHGFQGRLSLIDMSWCMPDAEELFKKIKIGSRIQCIVLEVDFVNKQVKLGQRINKEILNNLVNKGVDTKDLCLPVSDSIKWERIERGDEYNASIIEELNDSYILKTDKGIYGLIHKSLINDSSNKLKVKVNSKLDYSDLISFVPAF
jgi:ribosomal protein S1